MEGVIRLNVILHHPMKAHNAIVTFVGILALCAFAGCETPQATGASNASAPADLANMQRLVGNWRVVTQGGMSLDELPNPANVHFHYDFSLQGSQIVVTIVYDKDSVLLNILKGERRVTGNFHLNGRRLIGIVSQSPTTGIVSENFRKIDWSEASRGMGVSGPQTFYLEQTLSKE